mmetsp:Transcript_17626/g.31605  ORF Transcript_17626/g.31605 Transcript_17626/m.31605 type:complete len:259 (-) Transcript_17626:647-1423(-)
MINILTVRIPLNLCLHLQEFLTTSQRHRTMPLIQQTLPRAHLRHLILRHQIVDALITIKSRCFPRAEFTECAGQTVDPSRHFCFNGFSAGYKRVGRQIDITQGQIGGGGETRGWRKGRRGPTGWRRGCRRRSTGHEACRGSCRHAGTFALWQRRPVRYRRLCRGLSTEAPIPQPRSIEGLSPRIDSAANSASSQSRSRILFRRRNAIHTRSQESRSCWPSATHILAPLLFCNRRRAGILRGTRDGPTPSQCSNACTCT